jgi:putative transposase
LISHYKLNSYPWSPESLNRRPETSRYSCRFDSIEAARAHCQDFFPWHNNEHRYGGLGLHTAADVHHGRATAVQAGRALILTDAYRAHPERFVRRPPTPPKLPAGSWINPPDDKPEKKEAVVQ